MVIELAGAKRRETRFDRADVVAQPWAGPFERDAVAAHDVGADLGAQAQPEPAAGGLLQFPGLGGGDERAAGKRDRDAGRQLEAGAAWEATAALR